MKLLLVSTSTTHGTGYLEHCADQVDEHLTGVGRVLFIPFALADHDGYAAIARKRFQDMGRALDSLHEAQDPVSAVATAEAVFIGGGNTFRLLKALYDLDLIEPLRARVREGMPYMGTSAGSNMACPTVRTTNDMPIVEPPSLTALGFIPFQINPHYLDPDPTSKHMGETREERLVQYLEENETPVVGLREGGMIVARDGGHTLAGQPDARIFRRGHPPMEVPPGTDLDAALARD